jgi:hypothetical protein
MKSTSPRNDVLTPALAEALILGAQTGLFPVAVAESQSIAPELLETWLTMGLTSEAVDPYRSFALRYRAAEQLAQLPYIASIQRAATEDYHAAIDWLKLRYPEQWGKDATKNQSAGALAPSGGDEAAEEALVEQIFVMMPPALRRILEKYGVDPDAIVTPSATAAAPPPPAPSR